MVVQVAKYDMKFDSHCQYHLMNHQMSQQLYNLNNLESKYENIKYIDFILILPLSAMIKYINVENKSNFIFDNLFSNFRMTERCSTYQLMLFWLMGACLGIFSFKAI